MNTFRVGFVQTRLLWLVLTGVKWTGGQLWSVWRPSHLKQLWASQPLSSRERRTFRCEAYSKTPGKSVAGSDGRVLTSAPCSTSKATLFKHPWRTASSSGLKGSLFGSAPAFSSMAAVCVFPAAMAQYRAVTRRSENMEERSSESLELTSQPDSIRNLRMSRRSCSAATCRGEMPLWRTFARLLMGINRHTILERTSQQPSECLNLNVNTKQMNGVSGVVCELSDGIWHQLTSLGSLSK